MPEQSYGSRIVLVSVAADILYLFPQMRGKRALASSEVALQKAFRLQHVTRAEEQKGAGMMRRGCVFSFVEEGEGVEWVLGA
eukprot:276136-Pyramimonas_sp.AAC.1